MRSNTVLTVPSRYIVESVHQVQVSDDSEPRLSAAPRSGPGLMTKAECWEFRANQRVNF